MRDSCMNIIGIDPGSEQSGYVVLCNGIVIEHGVIANHRLLECLASWRTQPYSLAIEMIQPMMQVAGKTVFETCTWIGRFIQCFDNEKSTKLIYRAAVKAFITGKARGTDTTVRAALIERYGGEDKAIGKKRSPGPLYGIKSHAWQALAVAICASERQ